MSTSLHRNTAAAGGLFALSLLAGSIADDAVAAPVAQGSQTQVNASIDDFYLPGTQPNEITVDIFEAAICAACHGYYDPIVEPYRPWAASMMGQAGRDPIFYATLAIANQDVNFGGEACLRCHAPGGWLAGRSTPPDGSGLDPSLGDLDGVNCHFCHRMVDPVYGVENPDEDIRILANLADPPIEDPHTGSYIVDPADRRRGPFTIPIFIQHEWRESPFHQESLMCATCHDVSNPLLELQQDGTWQLGPLNTPHPSADKNDQFPVERTYSEWTASVFAQDEIDMGGRFGGERATVSSCQDCHMPDRTGTGCAPFNGPPTRPDVPEHSFSGANSWVLRAIRSQYPDFETGLTSQSVDDAIANNEAMLRAAADLEATLQGGWLRVRVTNMMGHKLPTGYGEGRRMWLDVRYFDAMGTLIDRRGGYDLMTADLDEASTVIYEVEHGIDATMSMATGLPVGKSLHFLLNNTTEKDNRIPARGFRGAVYEALGAHVVGATFEDEQYWSESRFDVPAAATSVEVRLFHQTTSKEYIDFLLAENVTDNRGVEAHNLWTMFGKSAPVEMAMTAFDVSAPPEIAPRALALGKQRMNGDRPELTLAGSTSASGGGAVISVTDGEPNAFAVLFASPNQASEDRFGGVINVGAGAYRVATISLDANGEATIPVTYGPMNAGRAIVYQLFHRDATDPFGIGMTNGLRVDVTQ